MNENSIKLSFPFGPLGKGLAVCVPVLVLVLVVVVVAVCVPTTAASFIRLNGLNKSFRGVFSSFPVLDFFSPKNAEGLVARDALAWQIDAVGLGVEAAKLGVKVDAVGFGLNSKARAFIFRAADGVEGKALEVIFAGFSGIGMGVRFTGCPA